MASKKNEDIPEIENEDQGDGAIITPFNPSDIKMDTQTVNLGYLIEMLEFNEINLMPDFQRSENLWTNEQKSRLIESILLGLPLPSFYFNIEDDGKWAVIDGLQRLGTLKKFILEKDEDKKLKLSSLEFLKEYNGKTYNELTREDKRRISGLKITLNLIQRSTPPAVKYIIFRRVNTAGLQLTPQEMRHALNQGVPANFIKSLSEADEFKRATCNSISPDRMDDRDLINRFLAFYLLDYNTAYEGELDNFLNEGMGVLYTCNPEKLLEIKTRFCTAMNLAYEIFEKDSFRKRYKLSDNRNPISKAVFDTLSVNLATLTEVEQSVLIQRKEEFKTGMLALFNDKEFNTAISSGTGKKQAINTRFTSVKTLLSILLAND